MSEKTTENLRESYAYVSAYSIQSSAPLDTGFAPGTHFEVVNTTDYAEKLDTASLRPLLTCDVGKPLMLAFTGESLA